VGKRKNTPKPIFVSGKTVFYERGIFLTRYPPEETIEMIGFYYRFDSRGMITYV